MSRLDARLLAALLGSLAFLLAVVIATAGAHFTASSARAAPAPSPSATPPLRVLSRAGEVTLLTDPDQSQDLFGSGAAPLSLAPAVLRLTGDAWRLTFPVRTASLNPVSLAASISPRGGVEVWGRQTMSAWTVLSFTRLRVTLGTTSTVSAVFDGTLGRHAIMVLDLAEKQVSHFARGSRHWVRIAKIRATMSGWLVEQLKSAFPGYRPVNHTLGTLTLALRLG